MLLRCTEPGCLASLSSATLAVYKHSNRVPADSTLTGSAEALRVEQAISSAAPKSKQRQ